MKNLPLNKPPQQQFLWSKIIFEWADELSQKNFWHCWQIAAIAIDAWDQLNTYNISLENLANNYPYNPEIQNFIAWAHSYKLICKKFNINYINKSNILKNNIYNNNLDNNLACFKITCKDLTSELQAAAYWAAHSNISGNIGIVVLDLEQNYLQVDYIFSNFLKNSEYNLNIPVKLNTMPLIKIVLIILKIANCYLTTENIKYEDFSKLLRTTFIIGADAELCARSHLDYILRKNIDYEFDWKYLINKLKTNNLSNDLRNQINIFLKLCDDFEKLLDLELNLDLNIKNNWSNFCKKLLKIFLCDQKNLSKDLKINNLEILLDQYLLITTYLGEHDFTACVDIIENLSRELEININNNIIKNNNYNKKNINIFSQHTALELNSQNQYSQFDYLWICGVSDTNWSEQDQLNPFLPIFLQKTININNPTILQTLINNTVKSVICSCPLYIDNNLVRINNLIVDFADFNIKNNLNIFEKNNLNYNPEYYEDNLAPEYKHNSFSGTRFLKLQAACPFQANAKIRLQAENLKLPTVSLDAITKGEIIHKTMECFWLKYKFSKIIKHLAINIIYQELFTIAKQVLKKLQHHKPASLNNIVIQIEAERIANLCCDFIKNYDLPREDFIVLYLEQKFTVNLNDLLINIKIDRIDQINQITPENNLNLLIIDYKTGNSVITINNWQDPRIDEPQLLIYSLCLPNIKELVLAKITTEPKFIELSNWQESKPVWYANLYHLAKNFQNGIATVDPKHGATTCRLCDLKYMCRV